MQSPFDSDAMLFAQNAALFDTFVVDSALVDDSLALFQDGAHSTESLQHNTSVPIWFGQDQPPATENTASPSASKLNILTGPAGADSNADAGLPAMPAMMVAAPNTNRPRETPIMPSPMTSATLSATAMYSPMSDFGGYGTVPLGFMGTPAFVSAMSPIHSLASSVVGSPFSFNQLSLQSPTGMMSPYPQFMNASGAAGAKTPLAKLLALQQSVHSPLKRTPLNTEDLQNLFEAAANHPNQTRCKRDIAIICLLLDLHASSGSIIRLTFENIPSIVASVVRGDDPMDMSVYQQQHYVHVTNVTTSEVVPTLCHPFTAWALRHWVLELVQGFKWNIHDTTNPLFVNSQPMYDALTNDKQLRKKPLKRDAISKVFQAAKARCGLQVHKNTIAVSNLKPIHAVYPELIQKFTVMLP